MSTEKKKSISIINTPLGPTKVEAMEFKNVKNDPILVQVEDGTTIKVNLFVIKVGRGIDNKTGGVLFGPDGEPFYSVGWTIGVTTETPVETMEKMMGKI